MTVVRFSIPEPLAYRLTCGPSTIRRNCMFCAQVLVHQNQSMQITPDSKRSIAWLTRNVLQYTSHILPVFLQCFQVVVWAHVHARASKFQNIAQ